MRNLKKVLSLALALVMLLGMMVIGAGAATNYTDADQISNLQAAEVADALGIIEGSGGQFMPGTELDRAQAAQIIARMMLGPDVAKTLTATNNKFVDAQGHWAAAAINYCANNGIIEGDGAVHYYPDIKVTGFQFAKMLLVALGYDAAIEGYNGSGWRTSVAVDALQAGLTQNVQVSDAVLTRDAAVQMVFNALTADMVYYTLKTDTFGQLDKLRNSKDDYRISSATVPGGSSTPTNPSVGIMQFCELHFPQLKLVEGDNDVFGNLIAQWKIVEGNKATTISSTDVGYAVQYTAAVTQSKIYTDLGMTAASVTIPLWVDGVVNDAYRLRNDPYTLVAGNGAVTTVWMNSRGEASRITVVNTYIGDVTAVNATAGTVTVMKRNAGTVGTSGNVAATGLAVGDVVLYTMATQAKIIMSAEKVTPITGTLNSYVTYVSANVDGENREYSAQIVNEANVSSLKKNVSLYLDKYGYIIDVVGAVNVPQYAYVIGMGFDPYTGVANTGARLLLATGEIANVRVGTNTGTATVGSLVSYEVNPRGEYNLTNRTNKGTPALNTANTVLTTRGSSAIKVDVVNNGATPTGTNTPAGISLLATGDTIFMVNTDSGYKVYKGIANVPTITLKGTVAGTVEATAYCATTGIASVVYIDATSADVETRGVGTDVVFILGLNNDIYTNADRAGGTDSTGSYYQYRAIVNGEITAILARDKWLTNQLFTDVSYDDQGIARLVTPETTYQGVVRQSNDVLTLNTAGTSAYVTMNTNPLVFQIQGGTILRSGRASVQTDSNDKVWYDAVNGYANLVIVEKIAGGDGGAPLPPAGGTIGGANVLTNSGDFANKAAILATLGSSQTWRFTGTIADWASWGSSTGVKAEDCVFMTFTTKAQTTATLKIMKNNEVVYMEPLTGLATTKLYMSWVDVASDVVHHAAGATGSLANPGPAFNPAKTAWPDGNYTWEVTASDGTLGSGSFTIAH